MDIILNNKNNKEKQKYTTIYKINEHLISSAALKTEGIVSNYFNKNKKYNIFSKIEEYIVGDAKKDYQNIIINKKRKVGEKKVDEIKIKIIYEAAFKKLQNILERLDYKIKINNELKSNKENDNAKKEVKAEDRNNSLDVFFEKKIEDINLITEDISFLRFYDFFLDIEDELFKRNEEKYIELFRTKVIYNVQEILNIDLKIKELFVEMYLKIFDLNNLKDIDISEIELALSKRNGLEEKYIKNINNLINKKEFLKKDLIEYMEEKLDKKTENIYSENEGSFKKCLENKKIELLKKYNEMKKDNGKERELYLYCISGVSGISYSYFDDENEDDEETLLLGNREKSNYINNNKKHIQIINVVNENIYKLGYKNVKVKGLVETYLFRTFEDIVIKDKMIRSHKEEIAYNKSNSFVSEIVFLFDNDKNKEEVIIDILRSRDKNKINYPIIRGKLNKESLKDHIENSLEYVIESFPKKIVSLNEVSLWKELFKKSMSPNQEITVFIENERFIKTYKKSYKVNIKYSKVQKNYVIRLYEFEKIGQEDFILFKDSKTINGFFMYFENNKVLFANKDNNIDWKKIGYLKTKSLIGSDFPIEFFILFERYMNSILLSDDKDENNAATNVDDVVSTLKTLTIKEKKEILRLKECANYFFKENKNNYGLKIKNIIYYLILKNNGIDIKDLEYEKEFNLDKLSYLFSKEDLMYLIETTKKKSQDQEKLLDKNINNEIVSENILYKDIYKCYYKEDDKKNINFKNKELNLFLEKSKCQENKFNLLIVFKEINNQLNKYLGKSLGKGQQTIKENKRIELLNKYIFKEISNIYKEIEDINYKNILKMYTRDKSLSRMKVQEVKYKTKGLEKNKNKVEYIIKNFITGFVKHINNQNKVIGYSKDKNILEMEKQLFLNLYSSCVHLNEMEESEDGKEVEKELGFSFFGKDIQQIEDINKMIANGINFKIFKIIEKMFPMLERIHYTYIEFPIPYVKMYLETENEESEEYKKFLKEEDIQEEKAYRGWEIIKYIYKVIDKKIKEYIYELMNEFKHNINGITGYSIIEYVHSIVSYIGDALVFKRIDLVIEEEELEYYKNKNEELNRLCVLNNKATTKEWLVRLPNSNIELTEWGNKLNNCVGSYFNRDSIVYGIFYDNELKYCIEEKPNGVVTQFRGLNNIVFPNKSNIEIEMVENISKVFQLNIKESGLDNIYYRVEELGENVLINKTLNKNESNKENKVLKKLKRPEYILVEDNEVLKYALEKKQNRKYIYDEFNEMESINSDFFDDWINKGIRNKRELNKKLKKVFDFVEKKINLNKNKLEIKIERQIDSSYHSIEKMEIEDIVNGKVVKKNIKVMCNKFVDSPF
jgi:hypothetical protein